MKKVYIGLTVDMGKWILRCWIPKSNNKHVDITLLDTQIK